MVFLYYPSPLLKWVPLAIASLPLVLSRRISSICYCSMGIFKELVGDVNGQIRGATMVDRAWSHLGPPLDLRSRSVSVYRACVFKQLALTAPQINIHLNLAHIHVNAKLTTIGHNLTARINNSDHSLKLSLTFFFKGRSCGVLYFLFYFMWSPFEVNKCLQLGQFLLIVDTDHLMEQKLFSHMNFNGNKVVFQSFSYFIDGK